MNNFNDEYCFCKECECDYDFTNNNQYGYDNCCSSCGENKYEEYLEEQELKKRKKINFNDLPCEIKSIIFEKNRKENNKKNVEKKLKEFNDEWGEDYQDDLIEFYEDDLISAYMFDDLKLHEKINIYKSIT